MKQIVFILFLNISLTTFSQNLISVQNGDDPVFYISLDIAISNSETGDTIYLPGGVYTLSEYIDKELHIIGAGSTEDSTNTTGLTSITSILYFITGADNSSIEGVKVSIFVGIDEASSNVSNIKIQRCYLPLGIRFWGSLATGFAIIENYIGNYYLGGSCFYSIDFASSENHYVSNNLITQKVSNGYYSQFDNNVFLMASSVCDLLSTINSTFNNNIFVNSNIWGTPYLGGSSCLFFNNLICNYNTSTYSGEFYNSMSASFTEIFIDYAGADYHLAIGSVGVNAGTDGTDIGIYGGAFPWKEGSVPKYPHIYFKSIDASTNDDGSLDINIKVAAQDN